MLAINLSDKASRVGARNVSALTMLQMIAHRVVWTSRKDCQAMYVVVESRAENGDS
jgi:hypothetical protein